MVGGGNGQPFIADDYLSVQRALDINADVVLMAKMVLLVSMTKIQINARMREDIKQLHLMR